MLYFRKYRKNRTAESCGGAGGWKNRKRVTEMTIKEIAHLAGVSSAAVSRYLNGGYVSDEKERTDQKSD